MLGSLICWGTALVILFTSSGVAPDIYIRCAIAMGFIFLGIFSRAVSVYQEVHAKDDNKDNKQNT
jgi:hypothetical protein